MTLEFSYPAPACGEADPRPAVLKDFHYLYFALLLCGLTAIVIVTVSLCTAPIPEEKASGVFRTRPAPKCSPTHSAWTSTIDSDSAELRSQMAGDGELLGLLIPK